MGELKISETAAVLAESLADEGRFLEAIEAYQAAISNDPDNAVLYNDLAIVYEEAEDLELAESAYKRALSLNPDLHVAYYNLGLLYDQIGLIDLAIECLERCLVQTKDLQLKKEARAEIDALERKRSNATEPGKQGGETVKPELAAAKVEELVLIKRRAYILNSNKRMRTSLVMFSLIPILMGIFGLFISTQFIFSSLPFLIIGLAAMMRPRRSMFLSLATLSGWHLINLVYTSMAFELNTSAFCIPAVALITPILIVLFFKYRRDELQYEDLQLENGISDKALTKHIERFLPWIVLTCGVLSIIGLIMITVVSFVQPQIFMNLFGGNLLVIYSLCEVSALLGIALGFPALLDTQQDRAITAIGMSCGGIVLATFFIIALAAYPYLSF